MPETYLTGAIQGDGGRLTEESVRFLRIGCGLNDFTLPEGRQRFSIVNNPPLKIGTEKNGGLAEGVALGKYHFAIVGLDMVANLPDQLQEKVMVAKSLGFQHCQLRMGISATALGAKRLEDIKASVRIPETLKELEPGTRIATKHVNFLERIIQQRNLNLRIAYDPTPETAPEFRRIFVVVANFEPDGTFTENQILEREVLLRSQAVLIRARKLPRARERIFNNGLSPLVNRALENPELWLNPSRASNYIYTGEYLAA